MEDMLFQYILRGVQRFTALQALDIGDCSISVSGSTRVREALRQRIVGLFSSFTRLVRLDLSYSDLQGHLGTLLDALTVPLQYLSIAGCAVEESDLVYLSGCKHSASLKEVHLNALVQRGQIGTPEPVLTCLQRLCSSHLVVAAIQSNNIDASCVEQLCSIVSGAACLKILDTLYNLLDVEDVLKITHSACKCASLRVLTVNLRPVMEEHEVIVANRLELQGKVQDILKRNDREDITMVVVAMGVAADSDD